MDYVGDFGKLLTWVTNRKSFQQQRDFVTNVITEIKIGYSH